MTALKILKKYQRISKETKAEYVSIGEVINDLYQLVAHQRMLKIPVRKR